MNRYFVSCIARIPCVGEPVRYLRIGKFISEYDEDSAIWELLSSIENDVDIGTICYNFSVYPIM